MAAPHLKWNGKPGLKPTVALAHGAGAQMDSAFMAAFAEGLAAEGVSVARFEFPYMRERRLSGTRRPPDNSAKLQAAWHEAIHRILAVGVPLRRLVIGGKSMGGRVASMIADEAQVLGLVCLGYPFHASGKPEPPRIEHLAGLKTPALFVQGTRDSLGSAEDVSSYRLSRKIRIHWIDDGNHNLKPRKATGRTEAEAWEEGIAAVVAFISKLEKR